MFGYKKWPAPPNWKIFIYCVAALIIICGLGWLNTHVLGDRTQYEHMKSPSSSAAGSASVPEKAVESHSKIYLHLIS